MGYTPAGYADTGGSYTFHFPDGNATIARLLVRDLSIPCTRSPGTHCRGRRHRPGRLLAARPAGRAGAHPPQQHRGPRPPISASRSAATQVEVDLCARRPSLYRPRARLRARLLEHDDPVPVPGVAGGAEGGAAQPGEDPARLHQRRAAQLEGVRAAGRRTGLCARRAITATSSESARRHRRLSAAALARRADPGAHGAHALPPGLPEHEQNRAGRAELLATRSRPSSATSAISSAARSRTAASIRRATSPPSRSIAGRTAMRRNTTRCSIPTCRRRSSRTSSAARASAESPSPIPIPAAPPTPTSAIDQGHRAVMELLAGSRAPEARRGKTYIWAGQFLRRFNMRDKSG